MEVGLGSVKRPDFYSKYHPMSKKIQTYRGAVQTWECDSNRHMNVMYYINKFELGGRNLSYEMGITKATLEHHNWGVAVVEHLIQYKKEVLEDDLLYIESEVIAYSRKTMTVLHTMYLVETDEVVSTARIVFVLLDKKTRKAVVIPADMRKRLEGLVG